MRVTLALTLTALALATPTKRGLAGTGTCGDAAALNLTDSWYYNWGLLPDGKSEPCPAPRAAEFVPMFWGCWGNCTKSLPPDYRQIWRRAGVRALLGFNEPDNPSQSHLAPAAAAQFWPQVQAVANQFDPPLVLVSPAMTHWDSAGRSSWLDQFFGNCSLVPGCDPRQIRGVAIHDYSGSAASILSKAAGAASIYNRPVWLTEFAVGSGKNRSVNDAFASTVLPQLEGSPSVQRFAWFALRNSPGSWVAESSLMPFSSNSSMTPTSTGQIYRARP